MMTFILLDPWQIEPDAQNHGRVENWQQRGPGAGVAKTSVPSLIQQTFPGYHGVAW